MTKKESLTIYVMLNWFQHLICILHIIRYSLLNPFSKLPLAPQKGVFDEILNHVQLLRNEFDWR